MLNPSACTLIERGWDIFDVRGLVVGIEMPGVALCARVGGVDYDE